MPSTDSTVPLAVDERHAAARLLEAVHDALIDERLGHDATHSLVGYVVTTLDRGALALRQGRPDLADRAVADLDRIVSDLASEDGGGS